QVTYGLEALDGLPVVRLPGAERVSGRRLQRVELAQRRGQVSQDRALAVKAQVAVLVDVLAVDLLHRQRLELVQLRDRVHAELGRVPVPAHLATRELPSLLVDRLLDE